MTTSNPLALSIGGKRDAQLVRSDWNPVDVAQIDGVSAKQITNVLTDNGCLTELWRADWSLDGNGVGQVFQRMMEPGAVSAWHVHLATIDRLACATGQMLVVLFDARLDSPTHGLVSEHRLGEKRPGVISIPPGIYHGVRNIGSTPAVVVNAVDVAYDYEDPDHYRVSSACEEIPYRW